MAAPAGFIFSRDAVEQLQETVRRLEREVAALQSQIRQNQLYAPRVPFYLGKANGTITAIDGDTLGEGTVDIYRPSGTDTDIGTKVGEISVLNPAEEVTANRVVGIQWGAWGQWYVTVEACPP